MWKQLSVASMCLGVLTLLAFAEQNAKTDVGKPKTATEISKVSLTMLEQESAKGVLSAKKNGVALAIKLKGAAEPERTDLEITWTLTYTGPRSPLIIVQPSLHHTSGATMAILYAVPKGKDFGLPFVVHGPIEMDGFVIDAFGDKIALPKFKGIGTLPPLDRFKMRTRTKDWFVTVAAGKSAHGVLTISASKLKEALLSKYPGQFDPKEPPRLFVDLVFNPIDRGEDFDFDAWVGELNIPINAVPALSKW